jgi:hypothetical protein
MARAQLSYHPGVEFPAIRLAPGERAEVSVVNRGTSSLTRDSSCDVTLQFLSGRGEVTKQTVVRLKRGEATSFDLSRGELGECVSPITIRTVVLFGYYGGAPPGPAVASRFDCDIVPKLEVDASGGEKPRLILMDAKPLPPPATPAQ